MRMREDEGEIVTGQSKDVTKKHTKEMHASYLGSKHHVLTLKTYFCAFSFWCVTDCSFKHFIGR